MRWQKVDRIKPILIVTTEKTPINYFHWQTKMVNRKRVREKKINVKTIAYNVYIKTHNEKFMTLKKVGLHTLPTATNERFIFFRFITCLDAPGHVSRSFIKVDIDTFVKRCVS